MSRNMVFIRAFQLEVWTLIRKHLLLYLINSPAWAVIHVAWRLNVPLRGAKLEPPPPLGRRLAAGLRVEATVAGLNFCPCIDVLDTACVCAQ